ncbi:MAG: polysaccharide deacetylase [Gracilibacter sp. BRH_c7a]|nr:MAG: polysaccharide deacetylase [Gracilibacter sp. BRH_c7a]
MFILQLSKVKIKAVTLAVLFISLTIIDVRSMGVSRLDLPVPLERVVTNEKVIALTINVDWGEEFIPAMLDELEKYDAKVTFFVTGRWAKNNSEMIKIIDSKGHQIENHGYYHSHPDKLPVSKTQEEIMATDKVIVGITGKKTNYYAPPYGERGPNGLQAASELGYTTVLWTLDTVDWKPESTPEVIAQRILEPKIRYGVKPEKNGAIVLMHPKENTLLALPLILSRLKNEGFDIVSIEKLITSG